MKTTQLGTLEAVPPLLTRIDRECMVQITCWWPVPEGLLEINKSLQSSLKLMSDFIGFSRTPHDTRKVCRKFTKRPTHAVGG